VEIEREKKREEAKAIQQRVDKFRRYSLMSNRFEQSTFENWCFREDNRNLFEFGWRYCERWDSVKADNSGLLLYGVPGCGKTYLASAIANELNKRGLTSMAISVARILRIIQDSYGYDGPTHEPTVGETEILDAVRNVDLLILDDLGVENRTSWSYDKLYHIIDTRYSAGKPLIVTTNLSLDELRDNLVIVDRKSGLRDSSGRIYDRIVEMCVTFKVNGKSWRVQKSAENNAQALKKKLGLTSEGGDGG